MKLIGKSAAIQSILNQVPNVAQSDASVSSRARNGTGKEMIARLVHQSSLRKSHPFVGVNCAAIPENLIESELSATRKALSRGG